MMTSVLQVGLLLLAGCLLASGLESGLLGQSSDPKLPNLYEYYTKGGVKSGLVANSSDHFILNGHPLVIYSGSFHYFRVVPQHWQRTLRQFKAAGLNSVQLYVPWNLHEDIPGHFDFKSPFLNLEQFLKMIKDEDMFAIVRPGPYICAEWEMGGFPSWLLRDPHMKLRSSYKPYLDRVKVYWKKVMEIVNRNQFTSGNGGSVIAVQLENEYFGSGLHPDYQYLKDLQYWTIDSGFKGLLFTSDPGFMAITVPNRLSNVMETANLNLDALNVLKTLKKKQPGKPGFITEFWSGWYDEWKDSQHHLYSLATFEHEVSDALFQANGSVNFYMFIGGTNFWFMNGDRVTTSYDYDAQLTESGNYTAKYHKTLELYRKLEQTGRMPKLLIPDQPVIPMAQAYGTLKVESMLSLETLLAHAQKTKLEKLVYMENLPLGPDWGQRYGFILYRVLTDNPVHKYEIAGPILDRGIFMVNGETVSVLADGAKSFVHQINSTSNRTNGYTYDMLVENLGRQKIGSGINDQRKGIESPLKFDDIVVTGHIDAYSLDFNDTFIKQLHSLDSSHWINLTSHDAATTTNSPAYYRATLKINDKTNLPAADTYMQLPGWTKASVFVNGFNIGRYWNVGPQKTLYVPGPLLRHGDNHIELFSLEQPGKTVQLIDHPYLG